MFPYCCVPRHRKRHPMDERKTELKMLKKAFRRVRRRAILAYALLALVCLIVIPPLPIDVITLLVPRRSSGRDPDWM